MKITFDEIRQTEKVTGVCEKCQKKRIRTITESMTENPWNKNEDGTVRNRSQIYEAVKSKLNKEVLSLQKRFICSTCYSKLPWPQKWPD